MTQPSRARWHKDLNYTVRTVKRSKQQLQIHGQCLHGISKNHPADVHRGFQPSRFNEKPYGLWILLPVASCARIELRRRSSFQTKVSGNSRAKTAGKLCVCNDGRCLIQAGENRSPNHPGAQAAPVEERAFRPAKMRAHAKGFSPALPPPQPAPNKRLPTPPCR
jgi:hypothetical protein